MHMTQCMHAALAVRDEAQSRLETLNLNSKIAKWPLDDFSRLASAWPSPVNPWFGLRAFNTSASGQLGLCVSRKMGLSMGCSIYPSMCLQFDSKSVNILLEKCKKYLIRNRRNG